MSQVKKIRLQQKFQHVAQILQQVDQAVMSVREKLNQLENWKTNLVNKLHACQIELMGTNHHHCHQPDKLQRVTSACQTSSQDIDHEIENSLSGDTEHRRKKFQNTLAKVSHIRPLQRTVNNDDDDDDDDNDASSIDEKDLANSNEQSEKENDETNDVVLESGTEETENNQNNEPFNCKTIDSVIEASPVVKSVDTVDDGAVDFDSPNNVEDASVIVNNNNNSSEDLASNSVVNNDDSESFLYEETTITTSPFKVGMQNHSSRKIRQKSTSSSSSRDSAIILSSIQATKVDKRLSKELFVSIKRLSLPPECERFVFESRSNTWTPVVKKARRITKPRQPSRKAANNSGQSKMTNSVTAQSKGRKGARTSGKRSITTTVVIPSSKRSRGQLNGLVKGIEEVKQNDKSPKRGRPTTKHVNKNKTISPKKGSMKDEGESVRRKRKDDRNVKTFGSKSLPKKVLNKLNVQEYKKRNRRQNNRLLNGNDNHILQLSPTVVNLEDDDDDDDEDEDSSETNRNPTLIAAAMTINHNPLDIPTDEPFDYTGQEMWADLDKDLRSPNRQDQTNSSGDSFMCEQCGHKSEALADLKVHQLYGKCNLPPEITDLLEFANSDEQTSPSAMSNPFDELRYGQLQSGDDIPFLNEEVVEEGEMSEEKVLVQPYDPHFVMWDGIVADPFSVSDDLESISTTTANGLLHLPVRNEFYTSPRLPTADPFQNN